MFDKNVDLFWTKFGAILGPVVAAKNAPKTKPKTRPIFIRLGAHPWMAQSNPKLVHKQSLGSNLLYLATPNDSLIICQAFTLFVNEPRFGHQTAFEN